MRPAERVIAWLVRYGRISVKMAKHLGVKRPDEIIRELAEDGVRIRREDGFYYLEDRNEKQAKKRRQRP